MAAIRMRCTPDHLRTFHGGFTETFDLSVRAQTLVAMGVLLKGIAEDYQAETERNSPSAGNGQEVAGQFGTLDLREDMNLTPGPPEFEMPAIGSPQEQAA